MTRGTMIMLLPDKVVKSTEFNGDMYPSGYGDEVMVALRDVEDEGQFIQYVSDFNKEHHRYDEDDGLIYEKTDDEFYDTLAGIKTIDFRNEYFKRFFSDWLFFVNRSGEEILVIDEKGQELKMYDNGVLRFNFGRINIHTFKIGMEK